MAVIMEREGRAGEGKVLRREPRGERRLPETAALRAVSIGFGGLSDECSEERSER